MGNTELVFSVEEGSLERLVEAFRSDFPAGASTQQVETATYLDTVDRRILTAGGTFETVPGSTGIELHWRRGADGLRARSGARPQFARNLPAGPLRAGLSELIDTRRLVPLAEIERKIEEFALHDEEQKTTARLRVVRRRARAPEDEAEWHPLPTVLQARSVRGYFHSFTDLANWLRARPELEAVEQAELFEALAVAGRLQAPEGSALEHFPTQRAGEATRGALRAELETWLAQTEGVRADLDPEALHAARVTLRRARSVLRQMERCLPPASRTLLEELRWLGEESGPQRDLDVLLGELESLERTLPQDVHTMLAGLRALAREERVAAHARILAALDSPRHQAVLAAWRELVESEEPVAADADKSGDPILSVLTKRIRKRHGRVVEAGERLGQDPTPAALHELRIQCKKLRYLIDAFRGLFPADGLARMFAALKESQEALGRANDAGRQAELVQELAERQHAAGGAPAASLIAAGRLLEELARRRAQATADSLRLSTSFNRRHELLEELLPRARESDRKR